MAVLAALVEMNCRREMGFFIDIPPMSIVLARILFAHRICTILIGSAKTPHDH